MTWGLPTINPVAVRDFLGRRLKDGHRAKRFTRHALEEKTQRAGVEFVTEPFTHQFACWLLAAKNPGYLLLLDMGLGKTKITLDLIEWRVSQHHIERALVLVPGVSNIGAWIEEAEIHQPELMVEGLTGTAAERWELLNAGEYEVLVATYAGWQAAVCSKVIKKGKRIPPKKLTAIEQQFQMVVYDESTAIKNHQSLSFRLARRMRKPGAASFWLALTGTPFGKDPTDLWSQFFAVDGGDTLGKTLGLFRAAFFVTTRGHWAIEHTFKKKMWDQLHRMMRHRSIRYSERECLDLPPEVRQVRFVTMPEETFAYYNRLVNDLIEAQGNFRIIENAYIRMRQLTSGWLKIKDEEDGEHYVEFKDNPKIDALLDLLEEIPHEEKVIVFNVYHRTGDLIVAALKRAKVNAVRLYGKTSDKQGAVGQFKHKPKVRVLVASKSGAFGLNLQVANHVIFFETFDSAIDRAQSERRVRRPGQVRRTFYWDLTVRGSIDERILAFLREGKSLFDALVEGDAKELLQC